MNYKLFFSFLFIGVVVLFSGCSSKQVFKPVQKPLGDWKYKNDLNGTIIDVTANGALVDMTKKVSAPTPSSSITNPTNRFAPSNASSSTRSMAYASVLYKDNIIKDLNISTENERLIGISDGWVITANIDGNVTLIQENNSSVRKSIDLKKTVAAASIQGDTLAVVFASDDMALYSLSSQKILFHAEGNTPIAVDAKIVNPYFLDDLVLFLTLDGRIVIVNAKEMKVLRSIIVSSAEHFNNITAFDVVGNNLVAASGYKLLSLTDKERREPYEIRNMKYDKDGIFIATKQGEIVNLTQGLQVKAKAKFPFAHFLGMILTDDRVYVLEKEGYIISLKKDLSSYELYDVDIDNDSYVYVGDKAFYVDDKYFTVKK